MKKLILILAVTVGLSACGDKEHHGGHRQMSKEMMDSMRDDLLKQDIAFSELSDSKGRNAAFAEYASSNATLLRPFSMPITGKDSIVHMLSNYPDSLYRLTWKPISSDVAMSGEIGFTYGTYLLDIKGAGEEEGTYCTVWHKDADKKWKYIVDTGNQGLSREERAKDKVIDAKRHKEEMMIKKEEKK
jgi:ketosteroid isomerase-like protein